MVASGGCAALVQNLINIIKSYFCNLSSVDEIRQKAKELKYTSRVEVRPSRLQLHLPANLTIDHLAEYPPLIAQVSAVFYKRLYFKSGFLHDVFWAALLSKRSDDCLKNVFIPLHVSIEIDSVHSRFYEYVHE